MKVLAMYLLTMLVIMMFILKYYDHFDGYHRIYKILELNDIINKSL